MKSSNWNYRIFFGAISALFLSGCATMGSSFDFKGPPSIEIGKTTKQQIHASYGDPFRTGYEDGKLKWTYGYYQYRLFGDSETKDLAITFNRNGVVSGYTYSSSNPDEVKKSIAK
jgi:hypothetical protein